jgi:hypothetical protein
MRHDLYYRAISLIVTYLLECNDPILVRQMVEVWELMGALHDERTESGLRMTELLAKFDKILAQHEALRTTNRELHERNKELTSANRKLRARLNGVHRTTLVRRAKKGTQ